MLHFTWKSTMQSSQDYTQGVIRFMESSVVVTKSIYNLHRSATLKHLQNQQPELIAFLISKRRKLKRKVSRC